jgi:hemin uptake protein HemP
MQTPTPPPTPDAKKTPTTVKSVDLFQGQKTIDIEHKGTIYRLQTTKLGKLILTK